ncbi:hypothetical protein LEP1GSC107_4116 [Leptospira interrogans serovar Grippotyphosa str. UI 12769]|nr:hypothetical protein LEP1GSC009_4295 [Leptospira interrogans serovar Grippotyphosa str. Andaman]EKO99082.1 hypothetical protein LEP1GSC057_2877 [Leptospira interrogans str. Brem 329]EKP86947.1 hypothetical protein LEP1GSC020_2357 [Leptospira interrogans serovar Grippotyphosa str. 2006006986]EMF72423.1 hypothetical protein LEP1GSC148_2963 [Leptospira interrogans serovar Canicola str. LT1962]EMJ52251.1 hypothetical protein LEP1GSC111_4736 [Leptospira interrogans str. UT126]EMN66602.1 hypothet
MFHRTAQKVILENHFVAFKNRIEFFIPKNFLHKFALKYKNLS